MAEQHRYLPDAAFAGLDRNTSTPLYLQVAERIETAIASGALVPGDRIDNEIELGERLGLSRLTVRRAIHSLVDKGLLVRRKGAGTQVARGSAARQEQVSSLFDDLLAQGKSPRTKVLDLEPRVSPAFAREVYGLEEGMEVIYVRRVRFSDDEPIAMLENYLPLSFADITIQDLESHGLNQLLRQRGKRLRIIDERVRAVAAPAGVASHLQIPAGTPILVMRRDVHDHTGVVVDCGVHHYRPETELTGVTVNAHHS